MTFQEIRIIATGPCIANQLRDVNTICRRSWYIATSETTGPIGTKLGRNVPWMVLYKVSVFRSSQIFNIAVRANNML
jgi:hypothetical protein